MNRMENSRKNSESRWTVRSAAAAAFFVLFLLIQTGVPLVRLGAPRPARFGWQMFSAARPQRARFTLVMRDGTSQPVDLVRYVALSRGEMDLETALPPHLCRVVHGLASVRTVAFEPRQARVYECPR